MTGRKRQAENGGVRVQHETRRRTVIFLDIDGVLQPPHRQTRFKHDLEELRRFLADRLADSSYLNVNEYDLGAIYYDWDRAAVERLRKLCEDFDAEIVISSDWRLDRSISLLKACFRVHDLDTYVTDMTRTVEGAPHYRAGEVKVYLDTHPEIKRFVIIDDRYRKEFDELFPDRIVHTGSRMEAADETRARQILSGQPIP